MWESKISQWMYEKHRFGFRLIMDWHLAAVLFLHIEATFFSLCCWPRWSVMWVLCVFCFFLYRTISWDCSLLKSRWMAPLSQHTGMYKYTNTQKHVRLMWTNCFLYVSDVGTPYRSAAAPSSHTLASSRCSQCFRCVFMLFLLQIYFVPMVFKIVVLHFCCQVCFNTLVKYSNG